MDWKLPLSIISKNDVIHVRHEIENLLEEVLEQRVANEHGNKRSIHAVKPRVNDFLRENDQKPTETTLKVALTKLEEIKEGAPRVRASFASEPSVEAAQQVTRWFRQEVAPNTLITMGVQPSIAGGIILQTPTKRWDFSLRGHILSSSEKFKELLNG